MFKSARQYCFEVRSDGCTEKKDQEEAAKEVKFGVK